MSAGTAATQAVTASKAAIMERAVRFSARFATTTSEAADRQTFWNEFFAIFGIDRVQVAQFELLAERTSTGRRGFVDLIYPGAMAVEHKSAGEDLERAMDQLLDYLPSLPGKAPWLLVACDFGRFRWENLHDGTRGTFGLDELVDNLDLFWWIGGHEDPTRRFVDVEDANLAATELMATIHDRLAANGYGGHALREWLTRLLFCLFADDTAVWPRAAFHAYLSVNTRPDGSDLGAQLAYLHQIMNTPDAQRSPSLDPDVAQFTYINGDLFAESLPIPTCDEATRDAVLAACTFNWSAISPAIFGSMFQNVMSAAERRNLGAHYTTEPNILRTIGPLFLDELTAELDAATTKPRLEAFLDRLASLTFFDPACGCGNFLVIAYREIRALETEALRRLVAKQGREGQLSIDVTLQCRVRVDQFYGIEIEEFPARIARTALYLMDHLSNRDVSAEFGQHFVRFPIPAAPHIVFDNALTLDWADVLDPADADYVFGNPPFVGMSMMSDGQGADADAAFAGLDTSGLRTGRLDYVAAWYAKALTYGAEHPVRFAFVSTNSITQGEQARSLAQLLDRYGYQVDFAHRTFAWTSEARGRAAVHVVIVGFSHGHGPRVRRLFDYPNLGAEPVESTSGHINWYLTHGPDVVVAKHRTPIAAVPRAAQGSKPWDGGGLIVAAEDYDEVAADPVAARYLREYRQGFDLIDGGVRWCLWLVDAPPEDLRASSVLRARLAKVAEVRAASKTASTRAQAQTPSLFSQIRQPTGTYLALPEVSSERRRFVPMRFEAPEVIAGNTTITIDGAPLWLFAQLASSMWNAWVRTIAGRLKSDIRLAPDLCYNAFPFVVPTDAKATAALEGAGQAVLDARAAHPGSSLADLYDPLSMPKGLVDAHAEVDRVVDRLFAPRRRLSTDADRLEVALARYASVTAAG